MKTAEIRCTDLLPDLDVQDRTLPSYWRRRPAMLRGHVRDSSLVGNPEAFGPWCRPPAAVRVYKLADEVGLGRARALKLSQPGDALRLRDQAEASGMPITILINNAERVSPEIRELRGMLGIPLPWREDDVVATYSYEGAGIGFHVGHEDGFIVQLCGSRRWRVWAPEAVSPDYQLAVLGDERYRNLEAPARSGETPLLDVVTSPGDALHVPALFPHEGVTLSGPSVSLSVAWRGVNRFRLAGQAGLGEVTGEPAAYPARWFGLVPDLDLGGRHALAAELASEFGELASRPVDLPSVTRSLTEALGAG
jgi:ribosomal protein L16 Arg81 hydroxylase